jgi:hypothetical protein
VNFIPRFSWIYYHKINIVQSVADRYITVIAILRLRRWISTNYRLGIHDQAEMAGIATILVNGFMIEIVVAWKALVL